MAANRFATMLHRNGTHKLVLLLIYAVLEWVLILLLLLNSWFGYLITKFASYFGLQKPCLWCSRVDHILEPGKHNRSYVTDLICNSHAAEISQLGFCSNHGKLVESSKMCWDCLASQPRSDEKLPNDNDDEEETVLRCCCCNERLSRKQNPDSYSLFRSSWGCLEYAQKGDLVMEAVDDDDDGENYNGCEFLGRVLSDKLKKPVSYNGEEHDEAELVTDEHQFPSNLCSFNSRDTMEEDCLSSSSMFICYEKEAMEDSKGGSFDIVRQVSNGSSEIVQHCSCPKEENDLIEDVQCTSTNSLRIFGINHRLIPVELIDFSTQADRGGNSLKEENLKENGNHQDENLCSESRILSQLKVFGDGSTDKTNESDREIAGNLETVMDVVDQSSVRHVDQKKQKLVSMESELDCTQEVHTIQINENEAVMVKPSNIPAVEYEKHSLGDLNELKTLELAHSSDSAADQERSPLNHNDIETSSKAPEAFMTQTDLGLTHTENPKEEETTSFFDMNQERRDHSCILSEPSGVKEDKSPDTPTSTDSVYHLDKKMLLLSEQEGDDGAISIEHLKTALKSERKTLSALYTELEEERSASAIAANQTMAMITRLQEEKAAMQMEALQYQRMMEEQSEYDQEALQLLNDLMMKREREKQELEKEVEEYRKKVLDYEEKEKMRMIRRLRDGSERSRNSSASCSHTWDSDGLSIDLNRELGDEDSSLGGHQENSNDISSPAEAVKNLEEIALDCVKNISILDESLSEFEEERLSILDQLKALEEKIIQLGGEDEGFSSDLKLIADAPRSNIEDFEGNLDFSSSRGEIGVSDGYPMNNDCTERKTFKDSMTKRLLPLLDAACDEHFINQENLKAKSVDIQNSAASLFALDGNKVGIEEEVDHVYERLQALEADREFLKNCMSSIKKGDKGMDLLHEILQHLRDLKNIEVQMRNTNDDEGLGEATSK